MTSRTLITPNGLIATAQAVTNEHSSTQSFYKLDESISRVGGYGAIANGTHHIVNSRESSRQGVDENNFSFNKLRLGDTIPSTGS